MIRLSQPTQFSPTLSPDLRRAPREDEDNDLLSLTKALHEPGSHATSSVSKYNLSEGICLRNSCWGPVGRFGISIAVTIASQTPPRSREKIHDTPECGNTCPRPASRQRMSAVGTISTIREQAGEERYFRGQKYGSKALSLKAGVFIPVIWVFL